MSEGYTADHELLQRIAVGEEAAFEILYRRYWQRIYILAYKHLQSDVAAEEIVQDVFMVIWNKRAQTNHILDLAAFLAGIARFEIYKVLAADKKSRLKNQRAATLFPIAFNQDNVLQDKMLLDTIGKLTNQLPEKCRLVFIYNKLLDMPIPEVAALLDISPKTAETHLTKALKFMRQQLGNRVRLFTFL